MSNGFSAGPLRDYLVPLGAVVGVLLLPFQAIVWTYIILGQAHFLMAYLYQYRGKKMRRSYLVVATLLFIGAGWYFFFSGLGITALALAVSALFAAHFALDEFTLHGETLTKEALVTSVGFTLLFFSFVLVVVFPQFSFAPHLALTSIGATVVLRFLVSQKELTKAERYLWFVGTLLAVLALVLHLPASVLGIIILLHVFNWYVGFGVRLRTNVERARTYFKEVAITLGVCVLGGGLFAFTGAPVLGFFFGLASYYAWAIAHIVLSLVSSAVPRA